jgi:hypothetical protein
VEYVDNEKVRVLWSVNKAKFHLLNSLEFREKNPFTLNRDTGNYEVSITLYPNQTYIPQENKVVGGRLQEGQMGSTRYFNLDGRRVSLVDLTR